MQRAGNAESSSWQGTSRYEVLRFIGRGGMGAVYEAHDRERNRRVAVKTLLRYDPGALYLFKQEFRTLSSVLHPNLVRLYDLVASESDGVFFTMELVAGRHFCDHVWRPEARLQSEAPHSTVAAPRARFLDPQESGAVPVDRSSHLPDGRPTTPADIDRLRDALRQLVEGVHAAHAAGKVHRDIKPSNVLVGDDGRVVLLDFGVAAELSRGDRRRVDWNMVGTPLYMAPEQALDEVPSPASDWYSVGVLVYEALVGKPPFSGEASDALYRKAVLDPPSPRDLVDGVPDDLNDLCCDLLRREPGERPNGRRVLRRLGVETRLVSPTPIAGFAASTTLIGRSDELRALHLAYVRMRTGGAVMARVRGPSGIGKSALVRNFLDGVSSRTDAVVLRACAYERESIAYKAADGVLDALSQCLIALERRGEALPLPPDTAALAHLFPVLRRAPAIPAETIGGGEDRVALRKRAFGALRAILSQLARRGPVILHLDDVQWGDIDSAMLLVEVIRPPAPPPILVILGYRDGAEAESGPFLRYVNERARDGFDVRDVPINPLTFEEARHLALNVLGSDDEAAQRVADAIAHGSEGNAFFVEDLARTAKAQGPTADAGTFVADAGSTLEDMIRRRVARLDDGAQRLLELAVVHGQPIPMSILGSAAGAGERLDSQVGELREGHFVRIEMRDGREALGAAHDRIREAIVASLPLESLRTRHRQLAVAYELEHDVDAEALVGHWFEAGESERAARHAEGAAERALDKLAFDRATQLYRLTLGALHADSPEAARIRKRLAEALSWAGRGAEAARMYLDEAQSASEPERTALERAAASQLLFSGQIDEGTRILRRLMARSGRPVPSSRWTALLWFLFYRVWVRVHGLRVEAREPDELPVSVRDHIEVTYVAAVGLAMVDGLIGASLVVRLLALALQTRHRLAIVAGALLGASQLATLGGEETPRERALVALFERFSARPGEPVRPEQSARATHALRAFLRGRWREAYELCESAYTTLPAARDIWNAHALAVFGEFALVYLGEARELATRLPGQLSDAEQRGDVMKIVNLSIGVAPFVFLAEDEPQSARRSIAGAFARWPQPGFLIPHWRALVAQVDIDLYEGLGASASARIEREATAIRKSGFTHGQYLRAVTNFARARSAIAASLEVPEARKAHLRRAQRLVRRLETEGLPWTSVLASMAHASLSSAAGDREAAVRHLRAAVEQADAADMALHAATARYRLAALLGGDEAAAFRKAADGAMRARDVRAPERFAAMLLPGRW